MIALILFAYTTGLISSANPCGAALIPAFFSRRIANAANAGRKMRTVLLTALLSGLSTVLGFALVFGIIGIFVSIISAFLGGALPIIGISIGILLVAFGIYSLLGKQLQIGNIENGLSKFINNYTPFSIDFNKRSEGYKGDFTFGLGYGLASMSCVLPVFAALVAVSSTGNLFFSVISYISFVGGIATILIGLSIAATISSHGMEKLIKGWLPYSKKFNAVVLTLAGIYIIIYWGAFIIDPSANFAIFEFSEVITSYARLFLQ